MFPVYVLSSGLVEVEVESESWWFQVFNQLTAQKQANGHWRRSMGPHL
jgi:hypothetical protein